MRRTPAARGRGGGARGGPGAPPAPGLLHQQHRHAGVLGRALCHRAEQGAGVGAEAARPHDDEVAVLGLRDLGDDLPGAARPAGARGG